MSSKLKELSKNMEIVNQEYVKIQKTLKDYLQKHKEDIVSIFGKTDFKVSLYELNPYSKSTVVMQVNNGGTHELVVYLNKSESLKDCSMTFKFIGSRRTKTTNLETIDNITNKNEVKEKIEEAVYKFIKEII
jgi:hypothetical protein